LSDICAKTCFIGFDASISGAARDTRSAFPMNIIFFHFSPGRVLPSKIVGFSPEILPFRSARNIFDVFFLKNFVWVVVIVLRGDPVERFLANGFGGRSDDLVRELVIDSWLQDKFDIFSILA
jgi:hypothetical protein